jgi:TPR repeat protein
MASRQELRLSARTAERTGYYVGEHRFHRRGRKHERSRFKALVTPLGTWHTHMLVPPNDLLSTVRARSELLQRAMSGDVTSQYYHAYYRIYRRGVSSDRFGYNEDDAAWDMMRRAANAGHVYAMEAMAEYEMDKGDLVKSANWFGQGADSGHPNSMYRFGQSRELFGFDLEAANWYRAASVKGHTEAALNLRHMYLADAA